jgi:type II secretory pathway component PulF
LKANSKEEVKNKLHKEGYSILSIKEIEEINDNKKIKFYFKAFKN